MKKILTFLLILATVVAWLPGCGGGESEETAPTFTYTLPQYTVPPTEPFDPLEGVEEANIYYVGPEREHKSITKLFMELEKDYFPKIIYLDEGTYDMFKEYKEAGVASPPDDVTSPDYFDYNVFLPPATRLIGVGQVRMEFAPAADEITYGESRTWSPLNILGECYIENIEIYCKNGRYCIHDDSHNDFKYTRHYYKNVRCIYEMSDVDAYGQRLGFNNTIGNGMAQGTEFLFEDCSFEFRGATDKSAFYTHESGSEPGASPTLTFINCTFKGGAGNARCIRLQNLASADLRVMTTFKDCTIDGGIYLTLYGDNTAQHYDVTFINSGNPPQMIDDIGNNRYPIKVQE